MQRRAFLASGVGLAAAVAGCPAEGADPEAYDIGMSTDSFRPATLTVAVGDSVVWRNTSKQGHTVTAYEDGLPDGAAYFATGGYDSQSTAEDAWYDSIGGRLRQGDTFEHTFEIAGDHHYFCIPHESIGMAGVVTVEPPE
jgi:plastocyanin